MLVNYVSCDVLLSDGFWTEDWPFPGAKDLEQRYRKQFDKDSTAIGIYYALAQSCGRP